MPRYEIALINNPAGQPPPTAAQDDSTSLVSSDTLFNKNLSVGAAATLAFGANIAKETGQQILGSMSDLSGSRSFDRGIKAFGTLQKYGAEALISPALAVTDIITDVLGEITQRFIAFQIDDFERTYISSLNGELVNGSV